MYAASPSVRGAPSTDLSERKRDGTKKNETGRKRERKGKNDVDLWGVSCEGEGETADKERGDFASQRDWSILGGVFRGTYWWSWKLKTRPASRSGFGFLLLSRLFPSAGISEQNGARAVISIIWIIVFLTSNFRNYFFLATYSSYFLRSDFFIGGIKFPFLLQFYEQQMLYIFLY